MIAVYPPRARIEGRIAIRAQGYDVGHTGLTTAPDGNAGVEESAEASGTCRVGQRLLDGRVAHREVRDLGQDVAKIGIQAQVASSDLLQDRGRGEYLASRRDIKTSVDRQRIIGHLFSASVRARTNWTGFCNDSREATEPLRYVWAISRESLSTLVEPEPVFRNGRHAGTESAAPPD